MSRESVGDLLGSWQGEAIRLAAGLEVWANAHHCSMRTVAVIDHGFRTDEAIIATRDPAQHANRADGIAGSESTAHGPIVADIIRRSEVSRLRGIAPNVEILPLKWPRHRRSDLLAELGDRIEEAVESGAHIINLSASWLVHRDHPVAARNLTRLHRVMDVALSENILLVVSVRNPPAVDLDQIGALFQVAPHLPHDNVICVTGVRQTPEGLVPCGQFGASTVDIAAPMIIPSPLRDSPETTLFGVSYSTAMVSGAAALTWGLMPHASALEVRHQLLTHARPLDDTTIQPSKAWGRSYPARPHGVLDLSFLQSVPIQTPTIYSNHGGRR